MLSKCLKGTGVPDREPRAMKSVLEAHILQNFSPSSLNLDESGSLKDCMFGGVRRARVSSQCWKRSMRGYVRRHELLPATRLAERSREFPKAIEDLLVAAGREPEATRTVVARVFGALGMDVADGETPYLVFLANSEIEALVTLISQNWDALCKATGGGRRARNELPEELRPEVSKLLFEYGKGGDAVDMALFGRMLMVAPKAEQETACQIAHALGTNALVKELDFFTAIDDLKAKRGETAAAHLGSQEFGSSCLYRYLALDLDILTRNLKSDRELVRAGAVAFVRAAVLSRPFGKQNSFAAHNPPGLVVLRHGRDGGAYNLANAFECPVVPQPNVSLTMASQRALSAAMKGLDGFLGSSRETVYWSGAAEDFTPGKRVASLEKLLDFVGRACES